MPQNYIELTTLIQFFKKSHFPQKNLIIFEESSQNKLGSIMKSLKFLEFKKLVEIEKKLKKLSNFTEFVH